MNKAGDASVASATPHLNRHYLLLSQNSLDLHAPEPFARHYNQSKMRVGKRTMKASYMHLVRVMKTVYILVSVHYVSCMI